jgi:hypothetical protein
MERNLCLVSIFYLEFSIFPQGGLAQLVERLLCKQDVSGSSPLTSTNYQLNCQNDWILIE